MAPDPPDPLSLPLTVVGNGRLGSALADALRASGTPVEGPLGRDEAPSQAGIVLLCVPDAEIPAAARQAAGARYVGHTSGATPLAALAEAPGERFGLHPLQTFSGGEDPGHLEGVGCAVAAESPAGLAVARALAERLGMRPFEIGDRQRAAYHAAASLASNYLVTLEAAAERVAEAAGLRGGDARRLLAPLVRSTVDNWVEKGAQRALTGPVARGDWATVERQRDALEHAAPDLLPLFDALTAATRALAAEGAPA